MAKKASLDGASIKSSNLRIFMLIFLPVANCIGEEGRRKSRSSSSRGAKNLEFLFYLWTQYSKISHFTHVFLTINSFSKIEFYPYYLNNYKLYKPFLSWPNKLLKNLTLPLLSWESPTFENIELDPCYLDKYKFYKIGILPFLSWPNKLFKNYCTLIILTIPNFFKIIILPSLSWQLPTFQN